MRAVGNRHLDPRGLPTPDLRPTIHRWFSDYGFEEVAFRAGVAPDDWGVGVNRLIGAPTPYVPDVRLFTFLDDLPGEEGAVG